VRRRAPCSGFVFGLQRTEAETKMGGIADTFQTRRVLVEEFGMMYLGCFRVPKAIQILTSVLVLIHCPHEDSRRSSTGAYGSAIGDSSAGSGHWVTLFFHSLNRAIGRVHIWILGLVFLYAAVVVFGQKPKPILLKPISKIGVSAKRRECIAIGYPNPYTHLSIEVPDFAALGFAQIPPQWNVKNNWLLRWVNRQLVFQPVVEGRACEISELPWKNLNPRLITEISGGSWPLIVKFHLYAGRIGKQITGRIAVSDDHNLRPLRRDEGANAVFGSFGASAHLLRSQTHFHALPDDSLKSENHRPCGYSSLPCYEYVPPSRIILALLSVILGGVILAWRWLGRWRFVLGLEFGLFAGWLILTDHNCYHPDQGGVERQKYSQPFQHLENVPEGVRRRV
jgi:hypothetical protein